MTILIFMICWIGFASFVDYFDISGPWAMVCGLLSVAAANFILFALESKHERA